MPVTLIQLVSEQTMQNVVPALALRPEQIMHLGTPRTAPRSSHILKALGQASCPTNVTIRELSEMPTIAETAAATTAAIQAARGAGLLPVVNFTGGTKLMSIGAYDAARIEAVTSVYVDTDRERLVDGGTGERLETVLGDNLSFDPIGRSLTVNVIAVANGCERVTGGHNWARYAEFARHLLANRQDEEACWIAMRGPTGILGGAAEPRTSEQWIKLSHRNFELPPAAAAIAREAGLLSESGAGWCLASPELIQAVTDDRQLMEDQRAQPRLSKSWRDLQARIIQKRRLFDPLIEAVQRSFNLLSGGWLEVALADAATKSGLFRDLRWSALTGGRGWGQEEEQDLLGVQGVQIALFSCKRGGAKAKLKSELQLVQSRARVVGGSFTRRFLCVARMPIESGIKTAIETTAGELGIRLITAEMLRAGTAFPDPQPGA